MYKKLKQIEDFISEAEQLKNHQTTLEWINEQDNYINDFKKTKELIQIYISKILKKETN